MGSPSSNDAADAGRSGPPAWMTLTVGVLLGVIGLGVVTMVLSGRQVAMDGAVFSTRLHEVRTVWDQAARHTGADRVELAAKGLAMAERLHKEHPWNETARRAWREARLHRGEALLALGEEQVLSAALEDFIVAGQGKGSGSEGAELLPRALLGEGRIRFALGDWGGSRRALDRLLARNPLYGAAYVWRARVFRQTGDTEQAERDEREARRLGEHPDETWRRELTDNL